MDAVEFVKKFGWDKAVELTREPPFIGWVPQVDIDVCELNFIFDDLKRLVESHEFVVANGGLDGAKEYCDLHDPNRRSKHYNSLRNKIADVEACK